MYNRCTTDLQIFLELYYEQIIPNHIGRLYEYLIQFRVLLPMTLPVSLKVVIFSQIFSCHDN
jgi:hypothetical protein